MKKKKLDEIVEETIEKETKAPDKELEDRIEKSIKEVIVSEAREVARENARLRLTEKQSLPRSFLGFFNRQVGNFRSDTLCWKEGPCRLIVYIMIISYIMTAMSIALCSTSNFRFCLSRSIFGSIPLVIILVLAATLVSSIIIIRKPSRAAISLSLLLLIPLYLSVLFVSAPYIGLLALVIILFIRFIGGRGRY